MDCSNSHLYIQGWNWYQLQQSMTSVGRQSILQHIFNFLILILTTINPIYKRLNAFRANWLTFTRDHHMVTAKPRSANSANIVCLRARNYADCATELVKSTDGSVYLTQQTPESGVQICSNTLLQQALQSDLQVQRALFQPSQEGDTNDSLSCDRLQLSPARRTLNSIVFPVCFKCYTPGSERLEAIRRRLTAAQDVSWQTINVKMDCP